MILKDLPLELSLSNGAFPWLTVTLSLLSRRDLEPFVLYRSLALPLFLYAEPVSFLFVKMKCFFSLILAVSMFLPRMLGFDFKICSCICADVRSACPGLGGGCEGLIALPITRDVERDCIKTK